MLTSSSMLKVAEAAVVSRVALRDVNRAIDEGILPNEFFTLDNGRQVAAVACTLIAFYFESADRLTSAERLLAIKEAGPRLRKPQAPASSALIEEDWIVKHEFLTIDLAPFVKRTNEQLARLEAARAMVTSALDVLSGTPVIRGTRIPVYDVAASASAGVPMTRILAAYPSLDAGKVELATIFAEANPSRGRPHSVRVLPKGSAVISNRRVPRNGARG